MANILLSTDFSDAAATAYEPTLELAKRLGVGVTVFHVVKDDQIVPGGHGSPLPGISASTEKETAQNLLRDLAARLSEQSGVEVGFDCKVAAHVAETIAEHANAGPFEMLCVATHGRTGWRHLVLGSVTEKILQHGKVPVVCYPVSE